MCLGLPGKGRYDVIFSTLEIEKISQYTEGHQSFGHLYITRIPDIGLEECEETMRIYEVAEFCLPWEKSGVLPEQDRGWSLY